MLQDEEKQFLSTLLKDEIAQQDDSVLCRELHKHTDTNSIAETLVILDFIYKGLCSKC